jgi:hypothetical protein
MTVEITDEEKEILSELLQSTYQQMLHELHHTDTADYKEMLKKRVDVVERLIQKIST